MVPTLLLTKKSRTFQDLQNDFPGLCRSLSNIKLQANSNYLLCIYSLTVQSIAKRSSQVAKKLFG